MIKSTKKKGNVIIFVGPSGSGKGTVLKEVIEAEENVFLSVSATTRAPRPGEVDGVNYYFISRDEFISRRDNGEMLEWTEYCGNFYGTPKQAVVDRVSRGETILLEIEVEGARSIKAAIPEAITVFIAPPSMETLHRRLTNRGTEDEETVAKRMATAKSEITYAYSADYIVVNDELENAVADFRAILRSLKCQAASMKPLIDEMTNK